MTEFEIVAFVAIVTGLFSALLAHLLLPQPRQ